MSDTSKEEVDLALLEKLLAEGHRHSDGSPCPRCQGPDALWRAALAPAKDAGGQPSAGHGSTGDGPPAVLPTSGVVPAVPNTGRSTQRHETFRCFGDYSIHFGTCGHIEPHEAGTDLFWHACCLSPGHGGDHKHHGGATWPAAPPDPSSEKPTPPAPASPTQGQPSVEVFDDDEGGRIVPAMAAGQPAPSPETAMREALDHALILSALMARKAKLTPIGGRLVFAELTMLDATGGHLESYELDSDASGCPELTSAARAALSPPAAQPETATALGVCEPEGGSYPHAKSPACVNWRALSSAPGGDK